MGFFWDVVRWGSLLQGVPPWTPILKPGSLGSVGESSVLVPECEVDPEMWRKEAGKQPLKVMKFDKIGKEQCVGERTGLTPSSTLQHSLAYRKS